MIEIGPLFEDAVGAQFLTSVLTLPQVVKERHDTLEFLNHIYIRHQIRLVVSVDGLPSSLSSGERHRATAQPSRWGSLETERGRTVVPLGDLDRHSRATTHIIDEASELVPLFTASKLNELLGSGLVSYAGQVVPDMTPELVHYLRNVPGTASANLQPAHLEPQEAADRAFDRVCEDLLFEFGTVAVRLLETLEFRLALATITSAAHLIVDVDPAAGSTRVLTYSYLRPITPRRRRGKPPGYLRRKWTLLARYARRSGTTRLTVDLGAMGGCDRYELSAEAPFDTWFADAYIERAKNRPVSAANVDRQPVDTSQGFRLSYTEMSARMPWSGVLQVELRTVYTGVARASVYASTFLAACAIAGLVRVSLAPNHLLLAGQTEAAASLLLLFPGVAASAVAGVAPNKLTATLQFPMRITLWGMSVASFVLAVAAGFGLGGTANIVLWGAVTLFNCSVAVTLLRRSRQWNQARHREEQTEQAGGPR